MAKSVDSSVLDGALNIVKNNCTRMTACAGQPTTFAEANTGGAKNLASVTMTSADFTAAAGNISGRKLTVASKSGVTVSVSGTCDHIALLDVTNSKLLYVTTATAQVLTSGNSMTFNSWKFEIADPA